MPTYLDFNSTKGFRDFMIAKTLNVPNGPQTFTEQSYPIQGTSDYANVDPGDVTTNLDQELLQSQTHNIFKPLEYWVTEYLRVIPRRANLALYPYFVPGSYSLVSIMATDNYDTESELFKFAANNIKFNENGPVFARIQQNLYAATVGRFRLIDALNGNLSTALNIVMGREPLIELNTKITVAKTLPGKAIDFLQTVTGTEWPFSEIPGHYLTDPRNPIINRPEANTEGGRFFQDLTGALGSLVGIQRRPLETRKPSDLFIEYTGQGPKQALFDLLTYSKYAPNYTKTARSQNTSKIFNFVDNVSLNVNKLFGLDAPAGVAYIGDDRGDNVKFAMGDFNDNQIRGPWYLGLMFDEVQARLSKNDKNIIDGGEIGGKLLWISSNSKNKLGANNAEYGDESADLEEAFSTKFSFRTGSILDKTQSILETLPDGGFSRTHVANAIDQTSRVFSEGGVRISRGSAIKYVDQYSGEESGVEYCRVWTKDRSYMNMSDLMKNTKLMRNQNIPEAGGSVLDSAYNLNIYPNSNGNKGFQGSTNIVEGDNGFYAKKYMFSLENLAWKMSNTPGYTYEDLPYCERGSNGGRVMWFPPYDLKVTEQNNANWEETNFLGRPEPVYTYQNTSRNGTVSFKVIVDHPSVLNLLVREHFKDMSDPESDNYINAFFAGCETVDFYDLIRKYTTLSKDDVHRIQNYLNAGKDPDTITLYKSVLEPVEESNLPGEQTSTGANDEGDGEITTQVSLTNTELSFQNDYPTGTGKESTSTYSELYQRYSDYKSSYVDDLKDGLNTLFSGSTVLTDKENDMILLYGKKSPLPSETDSLTGLTLSVISGQFSGLDIYYGDYDDALSNIKESLGKKEVKEIEITLDSATSAVATDEYNVKLSYRRSHSVIIDILDKIKKDGSTAPSVKWGESGSEIPPIPLKNLGYEEAEGNLTFTKITNIGESGDCGSEEFKTSDNLKRTAPRTFDCRHTNITISTQIVSPNEKKDGDQKVDDQNNPNIPKVNLMPVSSVPVSSRKPPLDELKRIIMKTLSECHYFKQFEEDSPVAFKSLKEKLRYFHPAFHSMTPEGLNARLTFLNQCIRPGDTMPIKGISDLNDLTARNTTFGPPPICVLRIGDFYHSKVAIRDVNIDYDESTWDLNPEGIGIQPMIANVTLQISFIGGHGLEKPVEMLQNALTSNFYANTEMYDHRAKATEDRSKFTKEFLEELLVQNENNPIPDPNTNSGNNIKTGEYIGVKSTVYEESTLEYSKYIEDVYNQLDEYFTAYQKSLYDISSKYGAKISSMFFSPTYRPVKDYTIQTSPSTSDTMELLGEYDFPDDFGFYVISFATIMDDKTENTNISTLMKLDKDLGEGQLIKSEQILKQYVGNLVKDLGDDFLSNHSISSVVKSRGELTQTLDKLNFVIEHETDGYLTAHDGATGVTFSDYTTFYEKYDKVVDHIQSQHHKFTDDLDTSFIFQIPNTMSDDVFSELLSILLYEHKEDILGLFEADNTFSNKITKIDKRLTKFVEEPDPIDVNLKKFPVQKDANPVIFTIQDELNILSGTEINELTDIMSSKVALGTTLNFYKNEQ